MPRISNQKLRPLCLMRIFMEQSDEANFLNASQLAAALAAFGISAGRKSIYNDIEALRQFGMDIQLRYGHGGGYYLASRDFELPELKLLADAVLSSRLITGKKSRALISKLSRLTSAPQAKQLHRQLYISGRAKTINETVYYSIDTIHAAIQSNKKISFKYFDYNIEKERVYRRENTAYIRTPIAMCWNEDKYYLITFSPKFDNPFGAFRVDRMAFVELLEEDADAYDDKAFHISDYVRRTFGMFAGEVMDAELRFDESLVSIVLDHFGMDTYLINLGNGHFCIRAAVSASPVFLSWIFQFGEKAEILAPESLRKAMRDMLAISKEIYDL